MSRHELTELESCLPVTSVFSSEFKKSDLLTSYWYRTTRTETLSYNETLFPRDLINLIQLFSKFVFIFDEYNDKYVNIDNKNDKSIIKFDYTYYYHNYGRTKVGDLAYSNYMIINII